MSAHMNQYHKHRTVLDGADKAALTKAEVVPPALLLFQLLKRCLNTVSGLRHSELLPFVHILWVCINFKTLPLGTERPYCANFL